MRFRGADSVLVVAVTVSASAWAFCWPTTTQDEFSLMIYPDLMTHGLVPNRDFFTPYGPGTYWPLALVFSLTGGSSVIAVRCVGLIYHVLLALAIQGAVRRAGREAAIAAGATAGVLAVGLLLIPYGWLLALAAMMASLGAADRGRWGLAGALGAAAVTTRPEFLVVFLAVYAVRVASLRSGAHVGVGFLLGAIPLAVHLALAGHQLLTNVFVDRVGVDTRLPIPPQSWSLAIGFGTILLAMGVLGIRAWQLRQRHRVALFVLALSMLPQVFQRLDRDHVLFVAVGVLPLALAACFRDVGAGRSRARERMAARSLVTPLCAALTGLGLLFLAVAPRGHFATVNGRTLFTANVSIEQQLGQTVRAISARLPESGTIFVGSTDMSRAAVTSTYLYYLMPRHRADAYFLELAPGISERPGSGLAADVTGADILALSEFGQSKSLQLFPYLKRGSNLVNHTVREDFCPVGEVHGYSTFPPIHLYRACGGGGVGHDDPPGAQCFGGIRMTWRLSRKLTVQPSVCKP